MGGQMPQMMGMPQGVMMSPEMFQQLSQQGLLGQMQGHPQGIMVTPEMLQQMNQQGLGKMQGHPQGMIIDPTAGMTPEQKQQFIMQMQHLNSMKLNGNPSNFPPQQKKDE